MDATGKGDAMQVQRKRHVRRVFVLLACIAAVLVLALLFLPRYQQPSTQRPPDRYAGAIEQLCSAADADGDGTDDQTDILQGALAYVGTYPKSRAATTRAATRMTATESARTWWPSRCGTPATTCGNS